MKPVEHIMMKTLLHGVVVEVDKITSLKAVRQVQKIRRNTPRLERFVIVTRDSINGNIME